MATRSQPPPDLPKRLPLVVEPENRDSTTRFDARLVNAYIESKKSKESAEYWIYERPGMDEQSRPPAGNATGRGIFNWRGDIFSVFGNTLYKNGVAEAGTVDTTNGNYRFDSVLGATPRLVLGNGVEAYHYEAGGGLVNISDGDFPSSFVKGWSYLNGTLYVGLPTANIQGSDINDPSAWNPLNTILAHIEPDRGMALAKQLVYTVLLKEWTTEVFYDAGNTSGSPLGRVEGAKINWGCLSADSVRELDGALMWLGISKNGSPEILLLEALKADVVSTKPIERLLEQADMSTVFSWTIKLDGHRFYVLTLKQENLTLAFDLDERMWSQWTDTNGNYMPIVDSCTNGSHQHLLQHESNGRIYLADNTYANDDGDAITVDIYTPNFDGGTRRRKLCSMLEIISDQKVGSQLMIRTNDHDYASNRWSNFRTVDLNLPRPYLSNMGTYVRRVHNFRYRAPVRMPRIQAVEMQLELGTL